MRRVPAVLPLLCVLALPATVRADGAVVVPGPNPIAVAAWGGTLVTSVGNLVAIASDERRPGWAVAGLVFAVADFSIVVADETSGDGLDSSFKVTLAVFGAIGLALAAGNLLLPGRPSVALAATGAHAPGVVAVW